MAYKYITPRVDATETRVALFDMPLSPDMLAIVRGFLVNLANPDKWEQIDPTSYTTQQAAAAGQAMLDQFEANI